MVAPTCVVATQDLISWEIAALAKREEDAEKVFNMLKAMGQDFVNEKIFGACNAVAVKQIDDSMYLILTLDARCQEANRARDLKVRVEKFGMGGTWTFSNFATVKRMEVFTGASQRRFQWGDADATEEDVAKAVNEEDHATLLSIMPAAKVLIEREELEHLPWLFVQQDKLALEDCTHEIFTEHSLDLLTSGPCSSCHQTHVKLTRCVECNAAWCKPCAHEMLVQQSKQKSRLQAYHETRHTHVWQDDCSYVCDFCNDQSTAVCCCGAVRCKNCTHTHLWTTTTGLTCMCGKPALKSCSCGEAWCKHCCVMKGIDTAELFLYAKGEDWPVTLRVATYKKMPDNEKLPWLLLELGPDADLETFAAKFQQLFGENVGVVSQKNLCLQLFRKYVQIENSEDQGAYDTLENASWPTQKSAKFLQKNCQASSAYGTTRQEIAAWSATQQSTEAKTSAKSTQTRTMSSFVASQPLWTTCLKSSARALQST